MCVVVSTVRRQRVFHAYALPISAFETPRASGQPGQTEENLRNVPFSRLPIVLPIVSVLYNAQTDSCVIQTGLKKIEPSFVPRPSKRALHWVRGYIGCTMFE